MAKSENEYEDNLNDDFEDIWDEEEEHLPVNGGVKMGSIKSC